VAGKRILELGAGTGYLSVLCAAHLGAEHVLASDGSDDVMNNLPDAFFLNGLQAPDPCTSPSSAASGGGPRIAATELKWGHALLGTEDALWNNGENVDFVLGADVTYDARIVPALVATLTDLLVEKFPAATALVAATERNRETFEVFWGACRAAGLGVDMVDENEFPVPRRGEQTGPFYPDAVKIHICRIRGAGDASK
jgi:predicted nicotinamide N-methyase